jgi:hypothetical protein
MPFFSLEKIATGRIAIARTAVPADGRWCPVGLSARWLDRSDARAGRRT